MNESRRLAKHTTAITQQHQTSPGPCLHSWLEDKCSSVCGVVSLTLSGLNFGAETKFGADTELESPSSSSFSRRVALEQPLHAPPLARRESSRRPADMVCRFKKRQRTLSKAAIVFLFVFFKLLFTPYMRFASEFQRGTTISRWLRRGRGAGLRQPIVATYQRGSLRVRN